MSSLNFIFKYCVFLCDRYRFGRFELGNIVKFDIIFIEHCTPDHRLDSFDFVDSSGSPFDLTYSQTITNYYELLHIGLTLYHASVS